MNQKVASSLALRLYLTAGALVVAMLVLAASVWYFMNRIGDHADQLAGSRVPQLMRSAEIELNVTRASLQLRHALLARTPQEMNLALDDVSDKKNRLDAQLEEFGKAMTTDAGRASIAPLPALMQEFWAVGSENVKLIRDDKKAEAFALLGGEPDELKNVVDSVAAGDLSVAIRLRPGDKASVLAGLASMTANLTRTVQLVRQNADGVATASAQIAQGNNDLSARTQ